MSWILTTFNWYFYLLILGVVFYPLTKKLFGSFIDYGYPFAKTLAILLITYLVFVLGVFKIVPFNQISLFTIVFVVLLFNIFILLKHKEKQSLPIALIIFEELLFIISLLFLTYVRGQEPSIRGLEKFMDFGFMNSILRSKYFPPLDMWLSTDPQTPNGYPINYYYFGHLSGALLIKLSSIKPAVGYNLILATIFAQAVTLTFSLVINMIYFLKKEISRLQLVLYGLIASFIVNLAGNLHTIYVFTKGYPNETPVPFWKIFSTFNPGQYWYPNATRFIPFTIHEFPSYSYVVADLHGHVFDIPFVLLTLTLLFKFFVPSRAEKDFIAAQSQKEKGKSPSFAKASHFAFQASRDKSEGKQNLNSKVKSLLRVLNTKYFILNTIILGFMTAVHYMTNAFDGPIYVLLAIIFLLLINGFSYLFLVNIGVLIISFLVFSLPFSLHFSPFVSGIGVNCAPNFLVDLQKFGPFLFERGNCQVSPPWMLFTLWGFFWVSFLIFVIIKKSLQQYNNIAIKQLNNFILILFSFSTLLLIIPEFFYIKDIYPAHFRANTMFKLGYQAFMMMGVASGFTFFLLSLNRSLTNLILRSIFLILLFLIFIYPFFSFPSYYGGLKRPVELDGTVWLKSFSPEDKEIVEYLNSNIDGQPVVLEAQGDSYTDYERISANTGLPTVAGWWVHEWLWRGSADIVGSKIPDIVNLYESDDIALTKSLINKYQVKYVVVSKMEKEKYKNIREDKFMQIGSKIFESVNGNGAIYQINSDGS